jgi:N-acetyl-anhydromuramyl-L-alanine amidase AmpD
MFFQAKNYTKGRGNKKVKLIVIHTMESGEQPGKAKQVAMWFAGKTAPDASAHYCVDNKSVVASVKETDTAWACGQSDINKCSISIELAGQASQTKSQWKDKYSSDMLKVAAKLVAQLCDKYDIPVKKLSPNQVRTGSGIIGHVDVTKSYGIKGGHTDPGVNFPWPDFIAMVESEYNLLGGK